MIVRLTQHKTVPTIAVVTAGPELANEMGRFAFARWQPQHKAFWVEERHLDVMRRELERQGHTVIDDRRDDTEEKFTGPLPECRSCGHPASRKAAMTLMRCTNCGDAWHPIVYETPGLGALPRAQCAACNHRQPVGGKFCGACGCSMPAPEPGGRRLELPREVLQDPIPVAQTIADLDLEEPPRERYP